MTEKRFKLRLSKLGNGMITDTQKKEDLYFDKEFLDATLPKTNEWLNELADENEQLKQFKEKVFTLIDKEIARNEEAIEWGKETGVDSSAMEFYNHMLKRLRKELSE